MFAPAFRNDPFFSSSLFGPSIPSLFDFAPVSAPLYLYESEPTTTPSTTTKLEKGSDRSRDSKAMTTQQHRGDQRVGRRGHRGGLSVLPSMLGNVPSMDMQVDMFSTPQKYSVHACVPGVDKKDINITVDDHVLTIQAERREHHATQSAPRGGTNIGMASSSPKPGMAGDKPGMGAGQQGQQGQAGQAGQAGGAGMKEEEKYGKESGSGMENEEVNWHHVESFYGIVSRRVQLPEDAKVDELMARYEDGIIKIDVPRTQEKKQQGRKVELQ